MKKNKKEHRKKLTAKGLYSVVFKLAVSVLVLLCIAVVPTLCISLTSVEDKLSKASKYKGVLELWNVDTFEGGTASKTAFLSNRAIEFSKQNKGLYIMVKNMSQTECLLSLESGQRPAMISYGIGTGEKIINYLDKVNIKSGVLPQFLNAGKSGDSQYGYAWCSGMYMLISTAERLQKAGQAQNANLGAVALLCGSQKVLKNGKTSTTYSVCFGAGGVVNPMHAYYTNYGKLVSNPTAYSADNGSKTAYNAYCDFIEGKANILIGTQRDLARTQNRQSQGKLDGLVYDFLGKYTDMAQFISVTLGLSAESLDASISFISYLLSSASQQALSKIGMFSTTGQLLDYQSPWADAQRVFASISNVQNVFTLDSQLQANKMQR